jgi:hypothetical protein
MAYELNKVQNTKLAMPDSEVLTVNPDGEILNG